MPKVMPVAIRDETGAFIRQMAQGNEALAQLYTRLLAQYEERRMNEAHQREMMSMREGLADSRRAEDDQRWYDRTNYAHNLRNPQAPQQPNLLGPGARGVANPMAPGTPPPTAAPTSAAPTARPSVYTIDNNPFRSGADTGTPAAPAPQKTSMSGEAANAYAQAPRGADHTDFSAQSRKPLPTVNEPPRTPRREPPPASQLPTQPRAPTARTAATRPQAMFMDIDQRWLDLMHKKEDEFGLPRGVMMTAYGIENGGGRQFGKNKSGSAEGIYQFHKDLRAVYKLTDQDLYNPEKMIHFAALNMRRNADILKQNYKVDLPNTPDTIPLWIGLHQWGEKGGPRLVAAYLQNPKAPMVGQIGEHKDARGNVIPNHVVLSTNGVDPTWTVEQALQNKALPWYRTYAEEFPNHAVQPQGKYEPTPGPPPRQEQPQGGDPNAPRPPGNIPPQQHGTMGTNPRLVAAVRGGASLALPDGYKLIQTSGARPGGRSSSHHHRGNAGDFQIVRMSDNYHIPNSGPDTTGLYTLLARGVKTWVRENDPGAEKYIGYGGAFETSRGSGRADIMHYDWGGSRGRLRPEVQFARLQPLSDNERVARTQQPQQPVKVAGATPTPDTTTPPVAPERAIMPAISRIPTSPEVAATFDNKIATAGFDRRTPDAAANLIQQGPPIKAGAGQLAARSDLEYGLPPEQQAANIPLPLSRPDIPQDITPQKSTLAARSDLDYNTPQSKTVTWEDALPTRTAAADVPLDVEVTPATRSAEPVELSNEAFTTQTPPTMPPRLDAGVVPKEPLPAEFTSATPQQATPDPMLGVPDAATPRAPLPPGFKVPWPPLDGGSTTAAANAPNGQMPRDMQLPPQLPSTPPEAEPYTPEAGTPTIQRIRDAIYNGNIPNLNTATDPTRTNQPYIDSAKQAAQQWLANPKFMPDTPNVSAAIAPKLGQMAETRQQMMDELRAGLPELRESWNTIPEAAKSAIQAAVSSIPPDRQQQFARAVADWVKGGQGASGAIQNKVQQWMSNFKSEPPAPKQHPTSQHPQTPPPAPIRTMPDGRPYIPQGEPLVVPPRPGSVPTNNTLSGGPQQGAAPIPAPPGKVNSLTGRVDVPAPVPQAGGGVLWKTPEELAAEQQQPVEQ